MAYQEFTIEGRNAVIEAYRSGKPIDKIFILDGCQDGPIMTIKREAKKHDTLVKFVTKERLDQMSETGKHQGVIAYAAAYEYAELEDIFAKAEEKDGVFTVDVSAVPKPIGNLGKFYVSTREPLRSYAGCTAMLYEMKADHFTYEITPNADIILLS